MNEEAINFASFFIQAPMFGLGTQEMIASANKSGCLGSLALAGISAEKSIELILECE